MMHLRIKLRCTQYYSTIEIVQLHACFSYYMSIQLTLIKKLVFSFCLVQQNLSLMACVTHEIYVKNMSLNMNAERKGVVC